MNCLQTRKNFPAFWQNTIAPSQRLDFLDHLARCPACDRSFRLFALTAPVLYGDYLPRWRDRMQSLVEATPPSQFSTRYRMNRWWAAGLAATMGAAAALALYLVQPPRVTLEDAFQDVITDSDPNLQRASFNAPDNLFGFQDSDSATAPDFDQQQPVTQGSQDDFGG